MKYLSWHVCLGGWLMLASVMAHSELVTVTVKLDVIAAPPCTINNNQAITVDFDIISAEQVNGINFLRTIVYTLECTANSSNAMKMKVQGAPTSFNPSALLTDITTDFGIELRNDTQPLVINEWFNFTDRPILKAVPVKNPGVTLPGGSFSATATLMVAYQ